MKKRRKNQNNMGGYTLVELLIFLGVLSIAAIIVAKFID